MGGLPPNPDWNRTNVCLILLRADCLSDVNIPFNRCCHLLLSANIAPWHWSINARNGSSFHQAADSKFYQLNGIETDNFSTLGSISGSAGTCCFGAREALLTKQGSSSDENWRACLSLRSGNLRLRDDSIAAFCAGCECGQHRTGWSTSGFMIFSRQTTQTALFVKLTYGTNCLLRRCQGRTGFL
jgi:hypothetical protein